MCGRFTFATAPEVVAEFFELTEVPELQPRYNIAPTQPASVVYVPPPSTARRLAHLRWGLIPPWADDPAAGSKMINARAETVATKPSYRAAFRKRRCLIAADGFYEWKKLPKGKQPHYIRMADEGPFAFAGLWEHWEGPGGTVIESCAIITTAPNELLASIHDRMPVILCPEDFQRWIDPGNDRVKALEALLRPFPAERMTAFPVTTRVNSPGRDDPACIEPA